ncbi:WW domain binding protein 4 [Seminavis robusta]|uniref:WW domain binding protein 4 n=1 Tax=Seminavis robusta TaxID=568900 RepID=A0A9N8DXM2_9STRA|nr:WW domain binding protein 4 [Seminavis robusta]|eukprot:Sro454_g146260.1 WW domain binding protein 4 (470) ;mRNA; f:2042-3451
MSSNSNNQGRMRSWQTKESRHYCAVCNVWMGNDRQSILLHENGKKHKEKVEESLKERRDNQAASDKQASQLQSSLKAMEAAALQSMATGPDSLYFDTTATLASRGAVVPAYGVVPAPVSALVPPPPPSQQAKQPSKKKEMKDWNARKKQRQDDKQSGKDDDDDNDNNNNQPGSNSTAKRTIAPNQGHYTLELEHDNDDTIEQKTYLEATTFAEILEDEMPIQIWLGSHLASSEEKRLRHHQSLWINGLVVAVRKNTKQTSQEEEEDRMVVDVVYLKNPETDTEETMERSVRLPRIRIVLGASDSIPETVEEARILALGGEEVQLTSSEQQQQSAIIDEATGLSGWSTVTIKRTTVHQQAREERARERGRERQAKRKADNAQKEAETRKMEESKVQNAEDSALGAYDVWGHKGGYKGVDIHKEEAVVVQTKKLAGAGEKVAFKKKNKANSKFKMGAKNKRNRRTTSADDD